MWRPVATFLIAVTLSASCGGTRPASRLSRIRQRGALVVAESSEHDVTLMAYFKRQRIALNRVAVADGPAGGRALTDGRRQALSADVSELASVRSAVQDPRGYRILADRISQEPLSQLVREEDIDLFNVLRWTVFAMIDAERLGVTKANVSEMATTRDDPEIARLLGLSPGNGAALGLDASSVPLPARTREPPRRSAASSSSPYTNQRRS